MRKIWVTAMIGTLLVIVGCKDGKPFWDKDKSDKTSTANMSAKDACTHCPGDQTVTAAGTCSKCGSKPTG